jgi:rhodanese-related sulfurtransferase
MAPPFEHPRSPLDPVVQLFTRVCTVGFVAIMAAGAHSLVKPVTLKPLAPPPLTAPSTGTPQPSMPHATESPAGTQTPAAAPAEEASTLDISLAQARGLYDQGIFFLDARSKEDYEKGHVANALHLPLEALEAGARPDALNVLDPSAKVVVYCSGGDCHASHDVVIRLNSLGYHSCYVMKDGFPAWQQAGYEITTGGTP